VLRVFFTPQLRRFLDAPPQEVDAATARDALESVFDDNPRLRGYVLDERGALRKHVTVFLGGRRVREPQELEEPLPAGTEVSVMQALSGG
jgi:molybdopterin converting factor small subunit